MKNRKEAVPESDRVQTIEDHAALSRPQRILLVGGLFLAVAGLCSGEWFALTVSHVLNAELRSVWETIIELGGQGRTPGLQAALERLREIASERAQAMSLHSHIGAYGLLAALVAVFKRDSQRAGAATLKELDAVLILAGATLQCLGMFLPGPHIAGVLSYSDLGIPVLCAGVALACMRECRSPSERIDGSSRSGLMAHAQGEGGLLLLGALLICLGLIFGLYVAWRHMMYEQPAATAAFVELFRALGEGSTDTAAAAFAEYKKIQTRIDITAASHSHAVSFGILIVLIACVMRAANLSRPAAAAARVLGVAGGFLLPLCVYLAPRYGFTFALFADAAGALMILAILIVLKGLLMNDSRSRGAVQ